MISLSIYGYKKYKKHQEKKKFREAAGEAPPILDQSAEFAQSPTSSLPSGPAKGGALHYAKSNSSGYSETASEPSSAVEPNSALEYQSYQQSVEKQSNSYVKGVPDQPPTYQAALSPPPEQARGQWIFVPTGGPVPFANGPPAIPLPPSPLPGCPLSPGSLPSSPLANEIPARPAPTAYTVSTPNELPAQVPMGFGRNTAPAKQRDTPRFELPAAETFPPSRELQRSESDAGSRKSGEMKRYELA